MSELSIVRFSDGGDHGWHGGPAGRQPLGVPVVTAAQEHHLLLILQDRQRRGLLPAPPVRARPPHTAHAVHSNGHLWCLLWNSAQTRTYFS